MCFDGRRWRVSYLLAYKSHAEALVLLCLSRPIQYRTSVSSERARLFCSLTYRQAYRPLLLRSSSDHRQCGDPSVFTFFYTCWRLLRPWGMQKAGSADPTRHRHWNMFNLRISSALHLYRRIRQQPTSRQVPLNNGSGPFRLFGSGSSSRRGMTTSSTAARHLMSAAPLSSALPATLPQGTRTFPTRLPSASTCVTWAGLQLPQSGP